MKFPSRPYTFIMLKPNSILEYQIHTELKFWIEQNKVGIMLFMAYNIQDNQWEKPSKL